VARVCRVRIEKDVTSTLHSQTPAYTGTAHASASRDVRLGYVQALLIDYLLLLYNAQKNMARLS